MSLSRDFHNYYGNCYVGFRATPQSPVIPFMVTGIRTGRNMNENDYSEQAIDRLRFTGYTVGDNGETQGREDVTLASGKLVLEMPELGYIRVNNRYHWLSFKPQRSMRKGLCGRRLDGLAGANFNDNMARQVYLEAHNKVDPLQRHFSVQGEELHYKGRRIGSVRNGDYELFVPYRYLSHFVRKAFGENVVVNLVEENQDA